MKAVLVVAVVAAVGLGVWAREPDPVPIIHGIASLAIPGLGQYLNGEYNKALVHFAVDVGIVVGGWYLASIVPYYGPFPLYWGLGLAHTAWALYSGWDAYTVALRQRGLSLELKPQGLSFAFNF